MGMSGTFLFGTITETIDVMKKENAKFGFEVDQLKDNCGRLKSTTKGVFYEVGKLQQDSKELEESLLQFEDLRKDLEGVLGQNKAIAEMVTDINTSMDNMKEIIAENERASLRCIYYQVSTMDREDGLSEKEYQRFMGQLEIKTRKYFKACGTFDEISGEDDIIDLQEFEE